ncbi:hypothetical protein LA66_13965 [Aureimonas altamirensis]|uniref:Uncharacterized protein n=1 Tax=Aureimonas altamirensis TaxID=370622 RepID=A0A0B1Q6R6_9HYPH|nr:AlpA family phage regulatory protein [Aureimonas altamirensis]KHJ54535.1 hypothetical protein LA66_13965 [Aureimonas altamirensis]
MKHANDNSPSRLVAPKEAATMTTLSRPLLTLMAKEGRFPKPVQIGVARMAYVRAEIEDWIDAQIAARG